MKGSLLKTCISLILVMFMTITMFGCGVKNDESKETSANNIDATVDTNATAETKVEVKEEKKEPVKVKYPTYRLGTSLAAPIESELIKGFKQKFGSEIELVVEEIPSDQAYTDKIKILIASGDLPDVVDGKSGVFDILVNSNIAIDLMPYMNADADWQSDIGDGAIKANSRDGKLYSICQDGPSVIGYFYNKDMFQKVGITPAKTWDEFFSNCDKLKAGGITPLALMTNENAWTTNLILASIVGTSDEGNKFMNTKKPKSFETPEFIDGLKKVQTLLQEYTTKDALGANYANAANSFMQGKTAMIANGPWMIGDFRDTSKAPAGFENKVGAAIYPNDGEFFSYWEGYLVCSKDKEHQDAAVEWVKYKTDANAQQLGLEIMNNIPLSPKVKITDEFKAKNPIYVELIELSKNVKYKYMNLDTINYANVTDAFKTLYPELVFNKLTPEGMAKKLSEIADKNED